MSGLYFLLPTLLVVLISFLVVRAAAIALMLTGLDGRRARFQALSAFTGTGFTTKEAESVIHDSRRRKIITWLMIGGNAGIVTLVVTATSSLVTSKGIQLPIAAIGLAVGLILVYKLATSTGFIKSWESFVEARFAKRRVEEDEVAEDLLHFREGFGLLKWIITETSNMVGHKLAQCRLPEAKILVLGIERGRRWISVPSADETFEAGDKMVIYGPMDALHALFEGKWQCEHSEAREKGKEKDKKEVKNDRKDKKHEEEKVPHEELHAVECPDEPEDNDPSPHDDPS